MDVARRRGLMVSQCGRKDNADGNTERAQARPFPYASAVVQSHWRGYDWDAEALVRMATHPGTIPCSYRRLPTVSSRLHHLPRDVGYILERMSPSVVAPETKGRPDHGML
jgi:hypothetical protein